MRFLNTRKVLYSMVQIFIDITYFLDHHLRWGRRNIKTKWENSEDFRKFQNVADEF